MSKCLRAKRHGHVILFDKNDLWDEAGKDKKKVKKLVITNGKY